MFWVLLSGRSEAGTQNIKSGGLHTPSISINYFSSMEISFFPQKVPTANAQPLDPSLLLGCPQLPQINEDSNYFSCRCGVRGIVLPQAVPIRPGSLKAADVWRATKDERLWRFLEDQRIYRDPLATELRESWIVIVKRSFAVLKVLFGPTSGAPWSFTLYIYATITNKNGNSKSPFILQNLILRSNYSAKISKVLIFLGTWDYLWTSW